jgi:hypothetical protein
MSPVMPAACVAYAPPARSSLCPMPLAIDTGVVLILVVIAALPIGAAVFALGANNALSQIGKGAFEMEHEMPQAGSAAPVTSEVREEEIRQMVQARSYRREARGEDALDVDAEVDKLLSSERGSGSLGHDEGLREEVRQLVVARNERRKRQGKETLDVDQEVERQLRELENLGQ